MLYFKLEIIHTPLEFREMIEIEHGSDEGDEREDNHDTSYYLINNKDAVGIKLAPDLVDEPGESEPPQQSSENDAQIAHTHFYRHIGNHKGKLGKRSHKEEYDERIAERNQERRNAVMQKRALLIARLVHILHRIALEAINTEYQQQDTSKNLKIELVLGIIYKIHHKTHAQACKQSIYNVAACGTHTCYKPIPATLVECTLDAKDAYRTHRG